jgi:uncharacterized membrane protein YebE (DUF533 family)
VAEQPDSLRADLILKAMIAVAAADGGLDGKEVHLIQQVYQDHAGKPISAEEIATAAEAMPRETLLAELSAAAPALDKATKEEIVRSAYLTLLGHRRCPQDPGDPFWRDPGRPRHLARETRQIS